MGVLRSKPQLSGPEQDSDVVHELEDRLGLRPSSKATTDGDVPLEFAGEKSSPLSIDTSTSTSAELDRESQTHTTRPLTTTSLLNPQNDVYDHRHVALQRLMAATWLYDNLGYRTQKLAITAFIHGHWSADEYLAVVVGLDGILSNDPQPDLLVHTSLLYLPPCSGRVAAC